MSVIDSIRLSGVTYTIQGSGGGGNPTVELTQAEYDALVTAGTVSPNTYYIITDASAGDLTQYWTSAQTNSAITEATSGKVDSNVYTAYTASTDTAIQGKQDTLVSGTNIKTINNESLLGSGNITIQGGGGGGVTTGEVQTMIDESVSGKQDTLVSGTNIKTINNESLLGSGNITIQGGGGGGKAVSGGTNISVTTGDTADTINCTLNLENGTNSQSGGLSLKSFVAGNIVGGRDACAFGGGNEAKGINSFVCGYYNTGNTSTAFVTGYHNNATNGSETLFGVFALSNGSYTGDLNGYSDATLLAVGNGEWRSQTRHNAFEIRQNGDIYIADTNDTSTSNWYQKPMIKLQDALGGGGGGSITIDPSLDTGSTNAVANSAITNAINSKVTNIVRGQANWVGSGVTTLNVNYTGTSEATRTFCASINNKQILTGSDYSKVNKFSLVETSAITTSITSSSTDAQVPSAKAVNDKLGGLTVVKLTESEYTALVTKDSNTLYVVVPDPSN